MQDDPITDHIYAIVLAAGAATRFGSTKQLARFDGEILANRALRIASEACGNRNVLVLGHAWSSVLAACQPLPGYFIINEDYESGIGLSVARGVAAVRHAAAAVLVILADQPLISAGHLRSLFATWSGGDREIVATAYADTVGVPALFPAGCFDRLCSLDGDAGARALLHDTEFSLQTVAYADAAIDIDTPEDLIRSEHSARS